jgi:hypothetical protein
MFVVITLGAGGRSQTSHEGIATFSTPTVVHFGAALLISALLSVPWHSLAHAAVVLGAAGLYGVAYTARSLLLAAGKGKMLAPGDPGRSSSTRAAGDGNVGPVLFPDRPCPGQAACFSASRHGFTTIFTSRREALSAARPQAIGKSLSASSDHEGCRAMNAQAVPARVFLSTDF